MAAEESKRQKLDILSAALDAERQSFLPHWREIAENFAPRRPRFNTNDKNRGDRRNHHIIDSTPVLAARSLMSGMMTGITSPARDWFRLTLSDQRNAEAGPVKAWLDSTTAKMNSVFLRSNLYSALPNVYFDLGTFGTAAMLIEEDFENTIRCYPIPIGSYCIGLSERHKVEVFKRDLSMTVREIIQKFGRQENGKIDWSNISDSVKQAFEDNQLTRAVDVVHIIKPNDFFDKEQIESKYKKFRSTYYEKASAETDKDKFLSEKGYDYFPVVAPRWQTTGSDPYAETCPGMDALGDAKQLQLGHRRMLSAIELMVRPPMVGPSKMKNVSAGIIPGKITYLDEVDGGTKFRRAFETDPRTNELREMIDSIQTRIEKIFYVDIFLMISNSDRRQITATEIDERREEKLLALGPVLEQLNQDMLDPIIDITFDFMLRQGEIDEPPPELQGIELKVEYISIMQQAQKLSGLGSVERFAQFAQNLIAANPQSADKIDIDQLLDTYADITSQRAGIVRSDDDVAEMRAQRAQAQQAQAKADQVQAMAQSAKSLSQADMGGDNALTRLMSANQAGALA